MKNKFHLVLICLLVITLVFTLSACGSPTVPPLDDSEDDPGHLSVVDDALTLIVKKVDKMPVIDGNPDDEAWIGTTGLGSHNTKLQGVYDDNEVAFMYTVEDPTLSIVTPDSWYFDGDEFVRWREYKEDAGDPIYRSWEMYNMAWETGDFSLGEGGCNFMCHTDDDGVSNHVVPEGAGADLWSFINKHGYGPGSAHETGFTLGLLGATQKEGPITYIEHDTKDPHQPTSGTFTFKGWTDERVQTSTANPEFAGKASETETGKYCLQCHTTEFVETTSIQGKKGEMPYRRNAVGIKDMYATAPEYIKTNPINFADAAIITDEDIEEGRAVKIAELSQAEVKAAWAKYEALNCLIPELILQAPTKDMATVLVGAQWSDGVWTVEIKRARSTTGPHDIQFTDINRPYYLSTAVSFGADGSRKSGAFGSDRGVKVIFENPDKHPNE